MKWLHKIRQIFCSGDFTKSKKVNYAVLKLDGDAAQLWVALDYVVLEATRRSMNWDAHSPRLQEHFCPSLKIRRVE